MNLNTKSQSATVSRSLTGFFSGFAVVLGALTVDLWGPFGLNTQAVCAFELRAFSLFFV